MASLIRSALPVAAVVAAACVVSVDDYPVGPIEPGVGGGTVSSSIGGGGEGQAGTTSTVGGAGGEGGAGGGGGNVGPLDGRLGDPCNPNRFCMPPLVCLAETDDEAGPAQGVCTKGCAVDSECPNDGYCALTMPGFGTCVPRCTIGDGDANKCRGRRDMACIKFTDLDMQEVDICWPSCNTDADCESNRVCNRRTKLCAEGYGPWALNGLGNGCNPQGATNACVGYCSPGETCQEDCVIGATTPCDNLGFGPPAASKCIVPEHPSGKVGDLGHCAPQCQCDADCMGTDLCNVVDGPDRYCGRAAMGPGMPTCP